MNVRLFLAALGLALSGAAQSADQNVPDALKAPPDEKLAMSAHGVGDQIYFCTGRDGNYTWTLKAPDARLIDSEGKVIGHHSAGPTWTSQDGSSVRGKAAATAPAPDANAVPWLLLEAIAHEGDGVMTKVVSIQRVNTKGGKAPAGGCDVGHAGAQTRIPYEADYRFYSK